MTATVLNHIKNVMFDLTDLHASINEIVSGIMEITTNLLIFVTKDNSKHIQIIQKRLRIRIQIYNKS